MYYSIQENVPKLMLFGRELYELKLEFQFIWININLCISKLIYYNKFPFKKWIFINENIFLCLKICWIQLFWNLYFTLKNISIYLMVMPGLHVQYV